MFAAVDIFSLFFKDQVLSVGFDAITFVYSRIRSWTAVKYSLRSGKISRPLVLYFIGNKNDLSTRYVESTEVVEEPRNGTAP